MSHDQAVEMARSGRIEAAIPELRRLYEQDPGNQGLLYDYLAVLSWAGEDERVAGLAVGLSSDTAPGYVLEAAAQSARRRGDYPEAERLYRAGVARFPEDVDFSCGLVMTLADAGQGPRALELSRELEPLRRGSLPLLLARGYAREKERDFYGALQEYDRVLAVEPDNRDARSRRILTLDHLGASQLAADLSRESPDLVSAEELERILANESAFAVRYGELPSEQEQDRFRQTDRALELLEKNGRGTAPDGAVPLRARQDRLVALRNRYEMDTVIREYELLVQKGEQQPPHVMIAAADAYLYSRQPEQARSLYERVLDRQPEHFDSRIGLFYAAVELEDFRTAFALADRLGETGRPWLDDRQVGDDRHLPLPDPERVTAELIAARVRIYGERYAEAEKRLTALHEAAPANLEVIRELGDLYLARGWPRRAQEMYELGLGLDPADKGLQAGMAQSYLELHQYRLAEEAIQRLYGLYPQDQEIRRLYRSWQIRMRPELFLSGGYWDNSGATVGTRETLVEGGIFSKPFGYHYRGFVTSRYAFAAFPEGDENYWREGVGLEYRRRNLEAAGEVTYNIDGGDDFGGRLSLLWRPDDHWSVAVNGELFSVETPLRAIRNDIAADAVDVGVTYRRSETGSVSLKGQLMDFSDGNTRRSIFADLEQRLVTLPTYKLSAVGNVYGSSSSREETLYFNPGHDFSLSLTLDNHHRLYRRYERTFSHRLGLTIGNYWQKGFRDDYFGGGFYEQSWEVDETLSVVYGLSRYRRVYDGDAEYHDNFYARINWRF